MIALVGVAVLAAAGVAVGLLSAMVARHPDRAAMLMVLAAAGGGMMALSVMMLGLVGVGLREPDATRAVSLVRYDPQRVTAGIVLSAGFLAVAAWLIRRGDWRGPG